MPVARRCVSAAKRLFSTGSTPKTSVLFLHFGQPRNAFYAKEFLDRVALDFYGVRLSSLIPSSFHLTKKIKGCVDEYDGQEKLEQIVSRVACSVEGSLKKLLPEFSPVSCHYSLPYDTDTLAQDIRNICSSGTSHLILFPLYGHFSCSQAGLLLNAASKTLFKSTSPERLDGQLVDSVRIVENSEISFKVSAIHRWHYHPSISDFWSEQLNQIKGQYDAVVFSSPAMRGFGRQEFIRSVWATAEKTMQKVETSVPWGLGSYNSWSEAQLPLTDSLASQVRSLAGKDHGRRRVAVVPVTELFPSFDTFSLLPSIISKVIVFSRRDTRFQEADVFVVHPPSSSDILTHGVSEVLKNHLLGRKDAQLRQFCCGCKKKDCEYTRLLLA